MRALLLAATLLMAAPVAAAEPVRLAAAGSLRAALAEVARIIGLLPKDADQIVEMSVAEKRNQVIFQLHDVVIVSQLIDANFPNYAAIVPKSHATRVVVDTKALIQSLHVARLFAREASNIVSFQVTFTPGQSTGTLTMTAKGGETGDNLSTLDVEIDGLENGIAFNVAYVLDVLNVIDTPEVALEITKASLPGVLRPVGDVDYVCVVMPMHMS